MCQHFLVKDYVVFRSMFLWAGWWVLGAENGCRVGAGEKLNEIRATQPNELKSEERRIKRRRAREKIGRRVCEVREEERKRERRRKKKKRREEQVRLDNTKRPSRYKHIFTMTTIIF